MSKVHIQKSWYKYVFTLHNRFLNYQFKHHSLGEINPRITSGINNSLKLDLDKLQNKLKEIETSRS